MLLLNTVVFTPVNWLAPASVWSGQQLSPFYIACWNFAGVPSAGTLLGEQHVHCMQDDWGDRAPSPGGIPADEAAWWDAGSADEADAEEEGGTRSDAVGKPRRGAKRASGAARSAALSVHSPPLAQQSCRPAVVDQGQLVCLAPLYCCGTVVATNSFMATNQGCVLG